MCRRIENSVLAIINLRCLLTIQVEMSSRQLELLDVRTGEINLGPSAYRC